MPTCELPEEAGSWAAGDEGLEGSKPGRCETPTWTIGGLRSVRWDSLLLSKVPIDLAPVDLANVDLEMLGWIGGIFPSSSSSAIA
jgi:hypothetical protein